MINTFPKQGHNRVVFNAMFYRNGKKLNSIEQAAVENFSPLVRSYDKSENPDKIKVEFKDQETSTLIWSKTFQWTDVDDEIPRSLSGYAGLGEAEVNDLVQRKFSEMEKSRELDRMLDGLGVKAKTAFLMSQVQGLTYPQIAEQLQVSASSVTKYMARATERCLLYFVDNPW